MRATDVQKIVAEIEEHKHDDERAHNLEDALYVDVLLAIADGRADDPQLLAQTALTTQSIKFGRYTA